MVKRNGEVIRRAVVDHLGRDMALMGRAPEAIYRSIVIQLGEMTRGKLKEALQSLVISNQVLHLSQDGNSFYFLPSESTVMAEYASNLALLHASLPPDLLWITYEHFCTQVLPKLLKSGKKTIPDMLKQLKSSKVKLVYIDEAAERAATEHFVTLMKSASAAGVVSGTRSWTAKDGGRHVYQINAR